MDKASASKVEEGEGMAEEQAPWETPHTAKHSERYPRKQKNGGRYPQPQPGPSAGGT